MLNNIRVTIGSKFKWLLSIVEEGGKRKIQREDVNILFAHSVFEVNGMSCSFMLMCRSQMFFWLKSMFIFIFLCWLE